MAVQPADTIFVDVDNDMEVEEEEQEYCVCAFDNCSFSTLIQQELFEHAESVHLKPKNYKCEETDCSFSAHEKSSLLDHVEQNHKLPDQVKTYEKLHECSHCNFKSAVKMELNKHLKQMHGSMDDNEITIDDGSSEKVVKCWYDDTCTFQTTNEENMGSHVKAMHLNSSNVNSQTTLSNSIVDNNCQTSNKNKNEIASSRSDKDKTSEINSAPAHAQDGNLQCIHCKQTFMVEQSLERHIKRNHSLDALSKGIDNTNTNKSVKVDDIVPIKKNDFNSRPSSNPSTIQCPYCPYRDESKPVVKNHIRSMHIQELAKNIKRMRCTVDENCNFQTIYSNNLENHVKTVHSNRKIKKGLLTCSYDKCKFTSAYPGGLKRHVNTVHKKIYEFTCNKCNQKFTTAYHLRRHVERNHTKPPTAGIIIEPVQKQGPGTTIESYLHRTSNDFNQQAVPGMQKSYPFDFEFLKNYLKVYESVKNIFDTTEDLQLREEILAKDVNDLLGYRRQNSEYHMLGNRNTVLGYQQQNITKGASSGFVGNENFDISFVGEEERDDADKAEKMTPGAKAAADILSQLTKSGNIDDQENIERKVNHQTPTAMRIQKRMKAKEKKTCN